MFYSHRSCWQMCLSPNCAATKARRLLAFMWRMVDELVWVSSFSFYICYVAHCLRIASRLGHQIALEISVPRASARNCRQGIPEFRNLVYKESYAGISCSPFRKGRLRENHIETFNIMNGVGSVNLNEFSDSECFVTCVGLTSPS